MRKYLHYSTPFLSGILSPKPEPLYEQASVFGRPAKDRGKIGRGWTLSSLASDHVADVEPPA
jgi:hypothetical protein